MQEIIYGDRHVGQFRVGDRVDDVDVVVLCYLEILTPPN